MPPDGMSSMFCSASTAIGDIAAIDMHGHYGPTGELLLRMRREAIPGDPFVRQCLHTRALDG